MAEVFTRRMSRWQAEQQREAVADVYVEAYRGMPGDEFRDREEFLRRFAEATQRPGFDMIVASERRMTGAAYGYVLDRADGWWRDFTGEGPGGVDLEELTASGQVFALAELMVVPAYRRQGIATRLLDQILLRSDAALITTLVTPTAAGDAVGAVGALRAWGWSYLGDTQGSLQAWSHPLRPLKP